MHFYSRFQPYLRRHTSRTLLASLLILGLAGLYAVTLQTHISGSFQENTPANILKNEYIKDVAEIQVALNVWGTIHHTGYPLFAITGNLFTLSLRTAGLEPAAAASLYATVWGVIMLGGFGVLIWRLTGKALLAAAGVLVLGLARSIWLHHVIAEVYSMSLALTMLMLLVALWPTPWTGRWSVRRRVWALALLGGIGVAHHRAVAFIAPGLILAVWPHLWAIRAQWQKVLIPAVGLALLGFFPYIYMPIRARQQAAWVYGEPGTLRGFWIEFTGKEADRLVRLPASLAELGENAVSVGRILVHELTLPGLVIGICCLGLATMVSEHRRAARIVAASAAGPLVFAVFYHTAVLPEAILMPVVLALVFGVALAADWLVQSRRALAVPVVMVLVVWGSLLAAWHYPYINELVTETSGLETIERLRFIPDSDQPAIMYPWGPRYAATAYAHLVTHDYPDLRVVDHKADYRQLFNDGYQLYTEPLTFFTYPPPWPTAFSAASTWWTQRIGAITITSAAPGYVEILNTPWLATTNSPPGTAIYAGILRRDTWLSCDDEHIYLTVIWGADRRPTADPSIFVHLTPDVPIPNPPNADSRHPVYGWYPFAHWSPGEIVRDDYRLARAPGQTTVRFGLYEQTADGQFARYGETALNVADCTPIGH